MTLVRDAVVRLRIEQQKAKLETPDTGPAVRAHEEVKRAVQEVDKVQREAAKTAMEMSRPITEAAPQIVSRFNEMGEGALRFGRGMAFLSASGSEDMRRLAQSIAVAQGSFDILAGGGKVVAGLASAFGPPGVAVAGLTLALGVGAVAWSKYESAAVRATKEAVAAVKRGIAEAERDLDRFDRELERRSRHPDSSVTDAIRRERIEAERQRLAAEQRGLEGWRGNIDQQIAARRLREGGDERSLLRFLQFKAEQDPAGYREQLSKETQLRDIVDKRLQLETEAARREAVTARIATSQFEAGLTAFTSVGFGGLTASVVGVAQQNAEQRLEQFTRSLQSSIDVIEKAYNEAAERVRVLSESLRQIEGANVE